MGVDTGKPPKKRPIKILAIVICNAMYAISLFVVFSFFILIGTGLGFFAYFYWGDSTLPPPSSNYTNSETSMIFDQEGTKLTRLHGAEHRVSVSLDDIPQSVIDAFIVAEDKRFFKHSGFDPVATIRAAIQNHQMGRIVEGGSTITQQLARRLFLSTEKSYERKFKEIIYAIRLEQNYKKKDLLEMYLNQIYFGNGAYGIEAAAQTYFDRSVEELELPEAALLAAIPSSPNYINPWDNNELSQEKQNSILRNMHSQEYIDWEEYNKSKEKELSFTEPTSKDYPYPYFLDYAIHHELVQKLKTLPDIETRIEAYREIYEGGLRVYTTLDKELQEHLECVLGRDEKYPETLNIDMDKLNNHYQENGYINPHSFPGDFIDDDNGISQPQSAAVIANPQNGHIRALGGGREYQEENNQVLRYLSLRQPGSALKPLVVYAPAFEEGILEPQSMVNDNPFTYQGWSPQNWDGRSWGHITAREALIYSRNIPAVRVIKDLSPYTATSYASQMGINTFSDIDRQSLAIALGGVSGVRALDMAQAYSVLAQNGAKSSLHTIKRIEDKSGEILYDNEQNSQQVLSKTTAMNINNILEETHRTFFNNRLHIDRPVAVKTGTSNYSRDAYLSAYTPNTVAIFWMGYDHKGMGKIENGHEITANFMREILKESFATLPAKEFN